MSTDSLAQRRFAVVGAGIAGASIAHALGKQGGSVDVFEQESRPAAGTSGLPVALAVPQISADDNPRSQLVRLGISLLRAHAQQYLVEGVDWSPSGVLERLDGGESRWHASALWIKPARLVAAWLAQSGIHFRHNACIAHVERTSSGWALQDTAGTTYGEFDGVILANAIACKALVRDIAQQHAVNGDWLGQLLQLQAVHGLMSHGHYPEPWHGLPCHPVNGNGSFVPALPDGESTRWVLGSTFVTDPLLAADIGTQHAQNLGRLDFLLPPDGRALADMLDRGKTEVWSGTRCTTRDRMPLLGQVPGTQLEGLWVCVGMGSRGLSLAALCAEVLLAMISGAPSPLTPKLARQLDSLRWMRRAKPSAKDR